MPRGLHTKKVVLALAEIALNKKVKPADRIAAGRELLDRGFGKPHTAVDIEMTLQKKLSELTLEEARSFAQMLDAAMPPMLIDASAETVDPEAFDGN